MYVVYKWRTSVREKISLPIRRAFLYFYYFFSLMKYQIYPPPLVAMGWASIPKFVLFSSKYCQRNLCPHNRFVLPPSTGDASAVRRPPVRVCVVRRDAIVTKRQPNQPRELWREYGRE